MRIIYLKNKIKIKKLNAEPILVQSILNLIHFYSALIYSNIDVVLHTDKGRKLAQCSYVKDPILSGNIYFFYYALVN